MRSASGWRRRRAGDELGGIGHSRMAARWRRTFTAKRPALRGFSHDEVPPSWVRSVRKLPAGRVLEKELSEVLGVTTIAELRAELPRVFVAFSEGCADFLLRASHGGGGGAADDDDDGDGGHQKGISCERTFATTSDAAEHRAIIGALSATLASQLAERGLRGGGVTLKLKTALYPLTRAARRRRRDGGAGAREGARIVRARAPHVRPARRRRRGRRRRRRGAGTTGTGCGCDSSACASASPARRPRPTRPTAASSNLAALGEGGQRADALGGGGARGGSTRRRLTSRPRGAPARGAARGARRDRRRPSAAAAATAAADAKRLAAAPRRRVGGGRRSATAAARSSPRSPRS